VLAIQSVSATRPAVEFASAAEAAVRAPEDSRFPADKVSLSPEARSGLRGRAEPGRTTGTPRRLDAEQERTVTELRQRDLHVRQHEAAHQAAGGELTGAATFQYQVGPDGRSYAVGGEVPIAARSGRTPDETISIARRVRAAALAPADPSSADLAAAASAAQLEQKAQAQKRAQQADRARGPGHGAAAGAGGPSQGTLERLLVRPA